MANTQPLYAFTICGICFLTLAGCTSRSPVTEISLESSGVSVTESQAARDDAPWPAWRGPENNGAAPTQPLVTSWNDQENIIWRADVPGRGHGSPIIVSDLVLLPTADKASQKQIVLAFDRSSGEERWRTTVHEGGFPPDNVIHQKATHANGTLACDGERVYAVFFNQNKIIASALDFETGDSLWTRELGAFNSKFGYAPSPILYKNLVVIAADNRGGGYLAGVEGASGEIAWRVKRPAISTYSSPVIANVGGKDQLLLSGCNAVTSFDPSSGEQRWTTDCVAEATCGTIVTTKDRIFASGGFPQQETVCLSADGAKLWSDKARVYEPSMLVVDDMLFAVTDQGVAYCWDVEQGSVHWSKRLGGNFSASPIVCEGRVYVTNLSGRTFVFAAKSDGYEQIAVNQLGRDCYASPAAADGRLFLRIGVGEGGGRREQLVCIGETSDAQSPSSDSSDSE